MSILCSMVGASFTLSAVAFSVPTAAFTNDANTKLLLHFNGTNGATSTTDDDGASRTALSLTAVNQTQISTAQSQFGGSSILFDGNDDYLTITGLPSTANSDFTWECWARFDILPWNQTLNGGAYIMLATGGSGDYFLINRTGAGSQVSFQIATANKYGSFTKSGVNLAINTWYHIAFVRNSGVWKVFFNGTDLTTFTNDSGFTNSGRTENMSFATIGRFIDSRGSMDGFMDEIRVSNSARYTGDFTPPASAFTNDANTLLLIHANGTNGSTTITDDAGSTRTAKTMTMVQSSLSTTQAKFGTASLRVDGTGADYVWTGDSDDWDLQTAPRTFEAWVYINSFTNISRNSPNHLPKLMGHMDQAGSVFWSFGPNTDQGMSFYYWSGTNNWFHSTTKDLVTGQWYHMVLINASNVVKIYVNGVEYISATLTNTPSKGGTNFAIGAEFGQCMDAYIDEVRVSHVNRYT